MRGNHPARSYSYTSLPVRRKRPFWRVARSALVLGLQAAVAFALVTAITGTPSAPADRAPASFSADDIAADPASFRSREVTVAGRVRPRPERVSKQDRWAFVLEGARDGRLLVVPGEGATLPNWRAGTAVVVRGAVVIPPDSRRLARRVASRTAVAERADAAAILKAADVQLAP